MMIRASAVLAAVAFCVLTMGPASAHRMHHHRHFYHRHFHHHRLHRRFGSGPVTIGLGDTIISGKTGFHRSDFGIMVPDSDPPPLIASGRALGSGDANGFPGSNQ